MTNRQIAIWVSAIFLAGVNVGMLIPKPPRIEIMQYDFSRPETHHLFEIEVKKRMAPPFGMTRAQAEMLVASLMWSPPVEMAAPRDGGKSSCMPASIVSPPKSEPDNVIYCFNCDCKTWHHGLVCEWADWHRHKE
jgi:hypothetical protein